MSKIIIKFLFSILMVAGLAINLSAQMQIPTDIKADINNRLATAENTIVTDMNGRVVQIAIQPVSGNTTEVLQLGYDNNGLSTVTDSRGVTITLQRNLAGEVQSFVFPDSGSVDINSKGCIAVDTLNITYQNKTIDSLLYSDGFQSYRPAPRAGNACRDAAWAIAYATAMCTATGGASIPCYMALANVAYQVLRCYEERNPRNIYQN